MNLFHMSEVTGANAAKKRERVEPPVSNPSLKTVSKDGERLFYHPLPQSEVFAALVLSVAMQVRRSVGD